MMPMAIGTTTGFRAEVPTSRPSTADSTEMAGVKTASPTNSEAPNSPAITSAVR